MTYIDTTLTSPHSFWDRKEKDGGGGGGGALGISPFAIQGKIYFFSGVWGGGGEGVGVLMGHLQSPLKGTFFVVFHVNIHVTYNN